VHSAPSVRVDAVVERRRGDLTVTDEYGTQKLGLTDLRLGVAAQDGVWHFTAALAGETLGTASGAVTARTGSAATWPEAKTPLEGVLELRIANLGTWGRWVPRAGA
jgi:translocation and assembly module TamB